MPHLWMQKKRETITTTVVGPVSPCGVFVPLRPYLDANGWISIANLFLINKLPHLSVPEVQTHSFGSVMIGCQKGVFAIGSAVTCLSGFLKLLAG